MAEIFLCDRRTDDGRDDIAILEHHFEPSPNDDFRMEGK